MALELMKKTIGNTVALVTAAFGLVAALAWNIAIHTIFTTFFETQIMRLHLVTRMKDPVCGMEIGDRKEFGSEHNGTAYYFCSLVCKEKFDKEPKRYADK